MSSTVPPVPHSPRRGSPAAPARPPSIDPLDFTPGLLAIERRPPSPLPRATLYVLLALFAAGACVVGFGRLDIVAVAHGKLVAESYLQVVQPAEAGIVSAILVREGDRVEADQPLVRLDPRLSSAELRSLEDEWRLKDLQLRRIDAELSGTPFARRADDPPHDTAQVDERYRARGQLLADSLSTERAALVRAQQELRSAVEVEARLRQTAPFVAEQETMWRALGGQGFAAPLAVNEKVRARMENDQALKAQEALAESLRASVEQSERRLVQLVSTYRQSLLDEQATARAEWLKLDSALAQRRTRHAFLELRAPQAGRVQELGTHTVGSVVAPGGVLVSLVPSGQPLRAEVWVSNRDIGFIREGQPVRLKLTAFQFQKYGLIDGVVRKVSADASDRERSGRVQPPDGEAGPNAVAPLRFRALVELASQALIVDEVQYELSPGMEVNAEIHLGRRTLWAYLTSPVRGAFHEAGRER